MSKKKTEKEIEKKQETKDSKTKEKEEKELYTKIGAKDGQYVCPNCGASEIIPNPNTGKLRCNYCFTEFDGKKLKKVEDLKSLKGRIRGTGVNDINKEAETTITLRCGGCGAEVVIDMENAPHARCHWCRSYLSINNKMDNGAIPDVILPFQTKKEEAEQYIQNFVSKRRFYANPTFKKEFTTENIMGVYFPYLLVDANAHAEFSGEGEHQTRKYYVGDDDHQEVRYDADSYHVERNFDITIEGLSIESNSTRLDKKDKSQTNNIINAIMPFDTENCIEYHSNYLIGHTSERRDINIDNIEDKVNAELKDVAKFSIRDENKFYDRGIHWEKEDFKIVGTQWLAAYLPVWLYSYQEVKGDKKVLHYVAVNARTNETMGSVPINKPLLFLISAIIEIISLIISMGIYLEMSSADEDDGTIYVFFLLAAGFIYYGAIVAKYRNKDARHTYEKETKSEINNLEKKDVFIRKNKGLKNPYIDRRNDNKIEGENIKINE